MSKLAGVVAKLAPILDRLSPEKLAEVSKTLDISFDEHFIWQSKKSELVACGKISLDDAMYIYEQLGQANGVFNSRPVAVKYTISQFMLMVLKP